MARLDHGHLHTGLEGFLGFVAVAECPLDRCGLERFVDLFCARSKAFRKAGCCAFQRLNVDGATPKMQSSIPPAATPPSVDQLPTPVPLPVISSLVAQVFRAAANKARELGWIALQRHSVFREA